MTITEKIKKIEDEMQRTQINKSTEHHIGILKAKISKLKKEQTQSHQHKTNTHGFDIKRNGDATVALIGFPSVGKSTLLNKLTSANSTVGHFQFTTVNVIPGIMKYIGSKIQILDLPGIIKGAASGKGSGKRIIAVARNADLILLMLDVFQLAHYNVLIKELENMGIRVNQKRPNLILEKTKSGGITINQQIKLTKISIKLLKEILHIYNINNARIIIKEDIDTNMLIDYINKNDIKYKKMLVVINKIDLMNKKIRNKIEINSQYLQISADTGFNLTKLKKSIYTKLELIRIYLKPKNGKPDFHDPLTMKKNSTILDICNKLHKNLKKDFRYCMVWGNSVKFDGQKVGLDHVIYDQDVVTIIKKNKT